MRCLDPSVSLRFLLRVDDPDKMHVRTWIAQLQSQLLHHVYVRFNEVRWQVLVQDHVLAPYLSAACQHARPVEHLQNLPVAHACRQILVRQPPATGCWTIRRLTCASCGTMIRSRCPAASMPTSRPSERRHTQQALQVRTPAIGTCIHVYIHAHGTSIVCGQQASSVKPADRSSNERHVPRQVLQHCPAMTIPGSR